MYIAAHNGLVEFTIGEIGDVSITTSEHLKKYGTYVSDKKETISFNKCDISRMITVHSTFAGVKSHWIISLEDFLPFVSEPTFRHVNSFNINLYSNCVFWFLDNTYAQNFLFNFSNYAVEEVQAYLKNVAMSDIFKECIVAHKVIVPLRKSAEELTEDKTTLKMLWDSGDLSFAPDPNSYEYVHRTKHNINLSLGVINQMTV